MSNIYTSVHVSMTNFVNFLHEGLLITGESDNEPWSGGGHFWRGTELPMMGKHRNQFWWAYLIGSY